MSRPIASAERNGAPLIAELRRKCRGPELRSSAVRFLGGKGWGEGGGMGDGLGMKSPSSSRSPPGNDLRQGLRFPKDTRW